MLQQALSNELWARSKRRQSIVTVVTQVLVDGDDPGFRNPTKPIGGFMSAADGAQAAAEGWPVVEDAGRGWRRVVASPIPRRIIENRAIRDLIARDHIVIAAGGGGIPVIDNERGELRELKGCLGGDRQGSRQRSPGREGQSRSLPDFHRDRKGRR